MFCPREFPKREQAISRIGQGSAALGKTPALHQT
jgi:hypothetical protein